MNPKRFLIVSITFIGGLYFFLEFLLPEEIGGFKFGKYHEQIILGVRVVGSMAFGLGIINIAQVHGSRILRVQKGWENSFALILGFLVMLIADGTQFVSSVRRARVIEQLDHLKEFVQRVEEERLSEKLAMPHDPPVPPEYRISTMLPVIGQHQAEWGSRISSKSIPLSAPQEEKAKALLEKLAAASKLTHDIAAAYRAQTHKKAGEPIDSLQKPLVESLKGAAQLERELSEVFAAANLSTRASQLLYNGFFVSLGSAMFSLLAFYIAGAAYRAFRVRSVEASVLMITATLMILGQIPQGRSISEHLPLIRGWLLENVNTPGNRAIYFGSAIAGLAMAVRMWLSLERSPLEAPAEEK